VQEVNVLKYHNWLDEGRSFEEIRNDLLIRGFSNDQATTIITSLNEWWLHKKVAQAQSNFSTQKKTVGFILLTLSLFISVYSLWITAFSVVVIAAGGIIGSLGLIIDSQKQNRNSFFKKRIQNRRSKN
jgi:hypothetical protein